MSAERAADAARKTLGLGPDGPVPDLLRLLEDEVGLFVFIVPLGSDAIEGAFQRVENDPFILINQDRGPVRKRFTLAHEFGHCYLDHGPQLDQRISFKDKNEAEREANSFAAALLAPRQAIDQWLGRHGDPKLDLEVLVRIAFFFNVSAFVIRYRLENENRLTPTLGRRFDEAIAAKQHLDMASALGLKRPSDSITTQHTRGGYVPAAMQAKISELLRDNLLTREAAISLLRISESAADEQLREMLEPSEVSVEKAD